MAKTLHRMNDVRALHKMGSGAAGQFHKQHPFTQQAPDPGHCSIQGNYHCGKENVSCITLKFTCSADAVYTECHDQHRPFYCSGSEFNCQSFFNCDEGQVACGEATRFKCGPHFNCHPKYQCNDDNDYQCHPHAAYTQH